MKIDATNLNGVACPGSEDDQMNVMLGPPQGTSKTDVSLAIAGPVTITAGDGGCVKSVTFFRTATIENAVTIQAAGSGHVGSVKINVDQAWPDFAPALALQSTVQITASDGGIIVRHYPTGISLNRGS